ncbi:hypothetical protein PCE1_004836 [Barthelona sp. PCE]
MVGGLTLFQLKQWYRTYSAPMKAFSLLRSADYSLDDLEFSATDWDKRLSGLILKRSTFVEANVHLIEEMQLAEYMNARRLFKDRVQKIVAQENGREKYQTLELFSNVSWWLSETMYDMRHIIPMQCVFNAVPTLLQGDVKCLDLTDQWMTNYKTSPLCVNEMSITDLDLKTIDITDRKALRPFGRLKSNLILIDPLNCNYTLRFNEKSHWKIELFTILPIAIQLGGLNSNIIIRVGNLLDYSMYSLLFLLNLAYKDIYILKPPGTQVFSNESYIVCLDKLMSNIPAWAKNLRNIDCTEPKDFEYIMNFSMPYSIISSFKTFEVWNTCLKQYLYENFLVEKNAYIFTNRCIDGNPFMTFPDAPVNVNIREQLLRILDPTITVEDNDEEDAFTDIKRHQEAERTRKKKVLGIGDQRRLRKPKEEVKKQVSINVLELLQNKKVDLSKKRRKSNRGMRKKSQYSYY